jgi:hypothetical protein
MVFLPGLDRQVTVNVPDMYPRVDIGPPNFA